MDDKPSTAARTRFLVAPAAAGKTQHCIDRIQQIRRDTPLAPIWVALPDAAQVGAFRRRLAESGGAIGVQVGTFYALYSEVLTAAGQSVPRLDEPVLRRLLRTILDELYAEGRLQYYAPLRDKPGFLLALRALIQELKRARSTPETFTMAVAGRGAHLEELATIYAGYQRWLNRAGWSDAEGQGWLAALALGDDPNLCADWRLLAVDGFGEFDPTQLEVVRRLAERVGETVITLTGSDPPRLVHHRFDRARSVVESALGVGAEPLPGARVRLAPLLANLEAVLFEPATRGPKGSGQSPPSRDSGPERPAAALTFVEAPTRAEEVRAALRWLKARLVADGLPPHMVAVLARDLEDYRPFLEQAAAEFGLPLALAQGARLNENPAIAALLDLLALPHLRWPRRLVVEAWRSPYFDWSDLGIRPGDAVRLERTAVHGQVIAGLEQWREVLERLADSSVVGDGAAVAETGDAVKGEERDEAVVALDLPRGAAAAELRARFDAFAERLTPPEVGTYRDYVAWLEALIGDDPALAHERQAAGPRVGPGIAACARLGPDGEPLATAERDMAALRRLKDNLRALVFAESVLVQRQPVSYDRFWLELRGVVESTTYRVPPPEGGSAIRAATVLASRGLSFRAVALLGLSDGEFPHAPPDDPLLRDADREMLARSGLVLDPPLLADEMTILYEAVTRGVDRLLVTRPYLAADGRDWEPSPYWEEIRRWSGGKPHRVRPEDLLSPAAAASWPEFRATVARGLSREHPPGWAAAYAWQLADDPAWCSAVAGVEVLAARVAPDAEGPFEGDLSGQERRLERDYGPDLPWSASRLETYAGCAHAFFASYTLGLERRQPVRAGYDVLQLGSMNHAVLEEVYRRAAGTGGAPAELLPEVAREVFDAAPERYGFRPTPLWERQRAELTEVLANTIEALDEESAGWEPTYFEPPFGLRGVPPLVLRGAGGETVRLRGYIDRVDVDGEGHLRILDYKSGASPIPARDLETGKRVQLALYAQAARDVLELGEPVDGLYWHIAGARPSYLRLGRCEGGIEAALEMSTDYALSYAAGARQGRFAPQPPYGGCPDWCPAADYCWRYAPRSW